MIDLFDNPKAILSEDFNPYVCSVFGISVGAPASSLDGWEFEELEDNWRQIEGGIAIKIHKGHVSQIRLPLSFFQRLETLDHADLIRLLGQNDEMRYLTYHRKERFNGYLWNKGIVVWWRLLPKSEVSHLVLFDPRHGITQKDEVVTFTLESGEERHRKAPETFELPPREKRENLAIGDLVKLLYRISIDDLEFCERMWTQVTEVRPDSYVGFLDNDPCSTGRIKAGMRVEFKAEHVIQIWIPPNV